MKYKIKQKVATVFGGSELGPETNEYQSGIKLGKFLAAQGYIVKCGGYYGLMEATAKGVAKAGGTCIGITNASFDPKPAAVTSGIRLGTAAITSRGFGQEEIRKIARLMATVLNHLDDEKVYNQVREEVDEMNNWFPTPGITS